MVRRKTKNTQKTTLTVLIVFDPLKRPRAQHITIPPTIYDYPSTYTDASIIGVSGTTWDVLGATECISGMTEGVEVASCYASKQVYITMRGSSGVCRQVLKGFQLSDKGRVPVETVTWLWVGWVDSKQMKQKRERQPHLDL